jgi:hypothetical protein
MAEEQHGRGILFVNRPLGTHSMKDWVSVLTQWEGEENPFPCKKTTPVVQHTAFSILKRCVPAHHKTVTLFMIIEIIIQLYRPTATA